tara:strand:- start:231 stop:374 length:144 start_codon:yes stop_codon:yes gene_type:complete
LPLLKYFFYKTLPLNILEAIIPLALIAIKSLLLTTIDGTKLLILSEG